MTENWRLGRLRAGSPAILAVAATGLVAISLAASPVHAGGDAGDIRNAAWLAEDIGGQGVLDTAPSTLEFSDAGQAGGNAGCNRYFSAMSLDGTRISFANLAATRRMCPPALMDQEQRFMQALTTARRFELGPGGRTLRLFSEDDQPVLRFRRME